MEKDRKKKTHGYLFFYWNKRKTLQWSFLFRTEWKGTITINVLINYIVHIEINISSCVDG